MGRIQDIFLDYESGILKINGKISKIPVKVVIKTEDGWNPSKLFNPDLQEQCEVVPELILDVTQVEECIERKRMADIVKKSIEKILDAGNTRLNR